MMYPKKLRYTVGLCIMLLGFMSLLACTNKDSAEDKTQRIISIGGNVTEIVYALGLGESVVAVDSTSTYPEAASVLPKVGYMRTLSVEGVMSLKPTLLILSSEAGPANVIEQLKSTHLPMLILPKGYTIENIHQSIEKIGAVTGKESEAQQLNAKLKLEWETAQASLKGKPVLKALFVMNHTGGLTVAGRDTAADAVLQSAGLSNIAHDAFTGYKALDAESLLVNAPDVIVTSSESLESIGGVDSLLSKSGLAQTNAAKNKHVIALPAMYLIGFGPRFGQALSELVQKVGAP